MITTQNIKNDLIKKLSDLSVMNQLVNVIYVNSNPAKVEYIEVQKDGDVIRETKVSQTHKLKNHRLILKRTPSNDMIISDEVDVETIQKDATIFDEFSMRMNRGFINNINDTFKIDTHRWKYFNRGFLNRIFINRSKTDLIHKIIEFAKNSSYIIVPESVAKIISKSNFFDSNVTQCQSIIKNIGTLRMDDLSINVYLDLDLKENKILFIKYNSVDLILNKNIKVSELKTSKNKSDIIVDIEYIFLQRDDIKCLLV